LVPYNFFLFPQLKILQFWHNWGILVIEAKSQVLLGTVHMCRSGLLWGWWWPVGLKLIFDKTPASVPEITHMSSSHNEFECRQFCLFQYYVEEKPDNNFKLAVQPFTPLKPSLWLCYLHQLTVEEALLSSVGNVIVSLLGYQQWFLGLNVDWLCNFPDFFLFS
jgi:hypothetical protein